MTATHSVTGDKACVRVCLARGLVPFCADDDVAMAGLFVCGVC